MERVDQFDRAHPQPHMRTAIAGDGRHGGSQVDPELRVSLAEADGRRAGLQLRVADRPARLGRSALPGRDRERQWRRGRSSKAHTGAPARTSLYTMESISAWNEASMMLGETPTVVQRSPLSSWLSIRTRVTASVPPLRMRTR